MTHVAVIVENAQWVLFARILANQGGVPVPVVPALFGVGALIASGRLSVVTTMVVAVGGHALCRSCLEQPRAVAGNQDACVDRALLARGPGERPAGSDSLP